MTILMEKILDLTSLGNEIELVEQELSTSHNQKT